MKPLYQVHYTLDPNKVNRRLAQQLLPTDSMSLLEHYNITPSGTKHYELLTKENLDHIPSDSFPYPAIVIRSKIETTIEIPEFLYVERHYKLKSKPSKSIMKQLSHSIMLAEVVHPTSHHNYILTLRATSTEEIEIIHKSLDNYLKDLPFNQEFCILDTNEGLDYLHE